MKKSALIKQLFFASLLIGGTNLFSSCNSCSNKEKVTEESTLETTTYDTDEDTVTTSETGDMNDGSTSSTSINAASGTSGSGKSNNGSTTGTAKATNTGKATTASGNAKNEEARQQAITDMVENSDAKSAVDKNGKPIRSSGDSGTGSGTGTGSTGNNSRVTTREAQKAN